MSTNLSRMRDLVQRDVGGRGLATVPGDNLLTAWPDDLLYAARSLAWHPAPHVLIATGFPIVRDDGSVVGETDGPLGARFLVRAFQPLGIRSTLVGEALIRPDMEVSATLPPLPDTLTHLLSIERVGPSWRDGRCYSMRGRDVTPHVAPVHSWFEDQRPPGVVTIAIGDGGNEIGMGKIPRRVIADNIARGEAIACRVSVDHLIVAAVSNWGAYALAAAVYLLRRAKPARDLFDPLREREELIRQVTEIGLVDGKTGCAEPTVDGLSEAEYLAVLPALRELLEG